MFWSAEGFFYSLDVLYGDDKLIASFDQQQKIKCLFQL